MTARTEASRLQPLVSALKTPFFPADTRRAALERFEALGFPTTKLEAWRHTDVSALAARPFLPARAETPPAAVPKPLILPGACARLTFVNGYFIPPLSDTERLPDGVEAGPLSYRPDVPPAG
jgi:Fe-S cluster assembly protein SufD